MASFNEKIIKTSREKLADHSAVPATTIKKLKLQIKYHLDNKTYFKTIKWNLQRK